MSFRNVLQALRDGEVSLDEAKRELLTPRTEPTALRQIERTEMARPALDLGAEVLTVSSETDRVAIEALQQELSASLAAVLYMDQCDIERDQPFVDMGLDSIVGVEWIAAINKQYGIKVAATKVYDYPNLEAFSGFLKNEIEKHGGGVQTGAPSQVAPSDAVALKPVAPGPPPRVDEATAPQAQTLQPEALGNPIFQQRYGCRFSYFAGAMYRGIASETFVVTMAQANLLSFFGSAGFSTSELAPRIQTIQSQLQPHQPYGICLISNLGDRLKIPVF